jgi:hypothetical protein
MFLCWKARGGAGDLPIAPVSPQSGSQRTIAFAPKGGRDGRFAGRRPGFARLALSGCSDRGARFWIRVRAAAPTGPMAGHSPLVHSPRRGRRLTGGRTTLAEGDRALHGAGDGQVGRRARRNCRQTHAQERREGVWRRWAHGLTRLRLYEQLAGRVRLASLARSRLSLHRPPSPAFHGRVLPGARDASM